MLQGLKEEDLVEAVKELDKDKESDSTSPPPGTVFVHTAASSASTPVNTMEAPSFLGQRRSSSVPPPHASFNSNFGWNMPMQAPFGFPTEHRLSYEERMLLGGRRASSARPYHQHTQNEFYGGFIDDSAYGGFGNFSFSGLGMGVGPNTGGFETRSASPLPEIPDADTSMFRPDFSFSPASSQPAEPSPFAAYSPEMLAGAGAGVNHAVGHGVGLGPLDGIPPDMDMHAVAEAAIGMPALMGPTDSMYASSVGSNSPGFSYTSPSPYTYESCPPNAVPAGHHTMDHQQQQQQCGYQDVLTIAAPRPRNPNHVWACEEEQQAAQQQHQQQQVIVPPQMDAYDFAAASAGYHQPQQQPQQSMPFDELLHSDAFAY
jgi:hypothetical protein